MSKVTIHTKILEWADDRGILDGRVETQVLKGISEVGELADAIIKQDKELIKDALGDILVVLHSVVYLKFKRYYCEDDKQLWYKHALDAWDTIALHELKARNIEAYKDIDNIRSAFHHLSWLTAKEEHPFDISKRTSELIGHLHMIALRYDLTLPECLESAYEEIKNRKGKTLPNGNFVKES